MQDLLYIPFRSQSWNQIAMPSHQCSSKTNSTELQPKRELVRFAFLEVLAKFTTLIRAELCKSPCYKLIFQPSCTSGTFVLVVLPQDRCGKCGVWEQQSQRTHYTEVWTAKSSVALTASLRRSCCDHRSR